jgi:hypothetical protein
VADPIKLGLGLVPIQIAPCTQQAEGSLHAGWGRSSVYSSFVSEVADHLLVTVGHDDPDQRLIPTDYKALILL